ncbi:hypothetical protein [Vibrio vulnificus]|uniref:hypothetical protein n=1 Tax=Vibrio vulnificus TaxID=672 RepID=UPI003242D215
MNNIHEATKAANQLIHAHKMSQFTARGSKREASEELVNATVQYAESMGASSEDIKAVKAARSFDKKLTAVYDIVINFYRRNKMMLVEVANVANIKSLTVDHVAVDKAVSKVAEAKKIIAGVALCTVLAGCGSNAKVVNEETACNIEPIVQISAVELDNTYYDTENDQYVAQVNILQTGKTAILKLGSPYMDHSPFKIQYSSQYLSYDSANVLSEVNARTEVLHLVPNTQCEQVSVGGVPVTYDYEVEHQGVIHIENTVGGFIQDFEPFKLKINGAWFNWNPTLGDFPHNGDYVHGVLDRVSGEIVTFKEEHDYSMDVKNVLTFKVDKFEDDKMYFYYGAEGEEHVVMSDYSQDWINKDNVIQAIGLYSEGAAVFLADTLNIVD